MLLSTKRRSVQSFDTPSARDDLSSTIEQMAARFYPDRQDVRALADRTRSEILLPETAIRGSEEAAPLALRHAILAVMGRIVRERCAVRR
jgi:hypothetical protein